MSTDTHKKWSFPLRISSANVSKSVGNWRKHLLKKFLTEDFSFCAVWHRRLCKKIQLTFQDIPNSRNFDIVLSLRHLEYVIVGTLFDTLSVTEYMWFWYNIGPCSWGNNHLFILNALNSFLNAIIYSRMSNTYNNKKSDNTSETCQKCTIDLYAEIVKSRSISLQKPFL